MKEIILRVPDDFPLDSTPRVIDNVLFTELFYPRSTKLDTIEIDLCDVRSTDSIRIKYDFDKDGWSILQASRHHFDEGGNKQDPDWQEVSFVQSWGRWSESNTDYTEYDKWENE